MATKGNGVDLIINCLPGLEPILAMLRCADFFGFCIQVADVDEMELHKLGNQLLITERSIRQKIISTDPFYRFIVLSEIGFICRCS